MAEQTIEFRDDDGEDDGGDDEGEVEVKVRTRPGKGKKKKDEEEPIENDEPIPLFPNLDKKAQNVIKTIRVLKRDPPGDGFKGDIHPTAGLDFVAKRWGNGLYDFHALNEAGLVLRRENNIQIAMAIPRTALASPSTGGMAERLLDRQSEQSARDSERAAEQANRAIAATQATATQYATMVREDTTARMERDRQHFAAQQTQMQGFFTQMFTMMTTMHRQDMERARESNSHILQVLVQSHQQSAAMNNPMAFVTLLERGMRLGTEMGGNNDDPLSVALGAGVQGLGHLKDMMFLQKGTAPPILPKSPESQTSENAQNPGKKPGKKKPPITRAELERVLRLKRAAESKGYSFEGMISQAEAAVQIAPEAHAPDPEEPEEDDNDDTGESPVADRDTP